MPFDSREFEYADTKVEMLGYQCTGLRGLTYKKRQDKVAVTGQGNEPKSIQRGEKGYDGTLMLLKSDFDAINKIARTAGIPGSSGSRTGPSSSRRLRRRRRARGA